MSDPNKGGQNAKANDAPTRIRNPGPNPRHYWLGEHEASPRDGLFAPGECRDITPAQAAYVRKMIDRGNLSTTGGINPRTGERFPPSVEFTSDPVITAAQLIAIEEAKRNAA